MAASRSRTRPAAKKKPAPRRTRAASRPAIPSPDEVLGPIGEGLTEKQRRFAHLYAGNPNATKAYKIAFPGGTEDTARVEGARLLKIPALVELVADLTRQRVARYDATADRTIRELARCALLDIADLYGEDGALLPIAEMPEDARRAIAGIEVEELFEGKGAARVQIGVVRKVKLVSKEKAVELLMRYHKLLIDKVEHSADASLEALLARSWSPEGGAHA